MTQRSERRKGAVRLARRPGITKSRVVEAAGEMADRIGYDSLTFSGVAEELGIRTPSLYNHIDGLDALRGEISLLGIRDLDRRLQRAALGKARGDALRAMLHAYRAFAKERPGVYAATLRAPDGADERLQSAADGIVETVLTVLEPFGLTSDEAIHAVRGFRAIAHGFASLEAVGAFAMALDVDESYERLIEGFLRGLDSAGGRTESP